MRTFKLPFSSSGNIKIFTSKMQIKTPFFNILVIKWTSTKLDSKCTKILFRVKIGSILSTECKNRFLSRSNILRNVRYNEPLSWKKMMLILLERILINSMFIVFNEVNKLYSKGNQKNFINDLRGIINKNGENLI